MSTLTVAYVEGVMPGTWLRRWTERHPGTPLRAEQVPAAAQEAVLRDGGADLCFVRLPVDVEGLSVIPLYEEQPVAVAARDHLIAAADEVTLADLAGEPRFDELPPAQAIEVVAAGAGVVIVPLSIARLHHRRDVVHRPVADAPPTRVALAWLTDRTSDDVEEFIGIVRGRTANSSRGGAQPPAGAGGGQKAGRRPAAKPSAPRRRRGR